MVYKLKLFIAMFTLMYGQAFADYRLYIKGDREDISDYLYIVEFKDQGETYLSLSWNELIFAEIKDNGCKVSTSVKVFVHESLNVGLSLVGVKADVVPKLHIELNNFDLDSPVAVILRYGNEPDSCSNNNYKKLHGLEFEFESISQFVKFLNQP